MAQLSYASGTSVVPLAGQTIGQNLEEAVALSHHNLLNNGFFVGEGCAYTSDDRVCVPEPLYHCFGMVMGSLGAISHGATIVLPSAGFEPDPVPTAIEKERCTSLYGVPTRFIAMLGAPDFGRYDPLSSLRTEIMAGSPCPVEVMKQVMSSMHMDQVSELGLGAADAIATA